VSIQVIGPGDKLKIHDEVGDDGLDDDVETATGLYDEQDAIA